MLLSTNGPQIVEQKQRVDDLETDLVIGKNHKGALLTINDRATGMLKMGYMESKEVVVVQAKAVELLADWKSLVHTGHDRQRGAARAARSLPTIRKSPKPSK